METKKEINKDDKLEITMRKLANLLIDRVLDDIKNDRLQYILKSDTIITEHKNNYGTH